VSGMQPRPECEGGALSREIRFSPTGRKLRSGGFDATSAMQITGNLDEFEGLTNPNHLSYVKTDA